MKRSGIVHLSTVHHSRDNRIYNKECAALLAAGHDVTLVIQADADETGPVPLVALRRPANRLARLTATQGEAWRILSRLKPRLLHVHDPELIPLAWAWSRLHGARCVYDAHENLVEQVTSKSYLPAPLRVLAGGYARVLTAWADRRMDAVVAATDPVAASYPHARTEVVHNFPWLAQYATEPTPVPGRLVYTGDLSEARRLSAMIEVARLVRERVPAAHLDLAGRALPSARRALERLDGSLVTLHGLLPPARLPELLASAQLGLVFLQPLPNYTASLPTKLFEYMAAGVPFVASDFPAWRERFERFDAGVFVDAEDPRAAASVVADLLADPERCARLGANGRAAVAAEFSFEGEAARLVGLVEDLSVRP